MPPRSAPARECRPPITAMDKNDREAASEKDSVLRWPNKWPYSAPETPVKNALVAKAMMMCLGRGMLQHSAATVLIRSAISERPVCDLAKLPVSQASSRKMARRDE